MTIEASSRAEIERRILRFTDLTPCKTAFIDARTPGSDQKENFCLIGGGVAENPGQVVHIDIAHGFDVGAARQPHGCKNSHHSHNTEEVFVVYSGEWQFTWGHDGSGGQIVLTAGDTISLPTQMFRGFENVGADDGFLFSVLGLMEDGTAGNVIWAPYVHRNATQYGLVLLEDGRLIDTAAGQILPADGVVESPIDDSELVNFQTPTLDDMKFCVQLNNDLEQAPVGGISKANGVKEFAVIGVANPQERIGAGRISWPHRFQLRRLELQSGSSVALHTRAEEEVLVVLSGELTVTTPAKTFTLQAGDLFTTPIGLPRSFANTSALTADTMVIRRGDHPQAATFL